MPTLRLEGVVPNQNDILLHLMLDHSEEKDQQAQIRITAYQQQIRAAYYKKVRPNEFQVGDLVLNRMIQSIQQKDNPCVLIDNSIEGRDGRNPPNHIRIVCDTQSPHQCTQCVYFSPPSKK